MKLVIDKVTDENNALGYKRIEIMGVHLKRTTDKRIVAVYEGRNICDSGEVYADGGSWADIENELMNGTYSITEWAV